MQDTVYAGTVAGTLGGVVILAVNLVLYVLGIVKTTILHAAAAIILPGNIALITPPVLLLGLVTHWLLAVFFGVLGVFSGLYYSRFRTRLYVAQGDRLRRFSLASDLQPRCGEGGSGVAPTAGPGHVRLHARSVPELRPDRVVCTHPLRDRGGMRCT
ncbi:MAG: hypothetical protein AB1374_07220 [Bacillota bacterium]